MGVIAPAQSPDKRNHGLAIVHEAVARLPHHQILSQLMIALIISPMFAAAGYSLVYLLGGGGLIGAILIFVVAKMVGK